MGSQNSEDSASVLSMTALAEYALHKRYSVLPDYVDPDAYRKTFTNRLNILCLKPYDQSNTLTLPCLRMEEWAAALKAANLHSEILSTDTSAHPTRLSISSEAKPTHELAAADIFWFASGARLSGRGDASVTISSDKKDDLRKVAYACYQWLDPILPRSLFYPDGRCAQIPARCRDFLLVLLDSDYYDGRYHRPGTGLESLDQIHHQLIQNVQIYLSKKDQNIISGYPAYINTVLEDKLSLMIAGYIKAICQGFSQAEPALRYQEMYAFLRCLQLFYRQQTHTHLLSCASQPPVVLPASHDQDAEAQLALTPGSRALKQAVTLEDLLIACILLKCEGSDIPEYHGPDLKSNPELAAAFQAVSKASEQTCNNIVDRMEEELKELPPLHTLEEIRSPDGLPFPDRIRQYVDETTMSPATYQELLLRLDDLFFPAGDSDRFPSMEKLSLYFQQFTTAFFEAFAIHTPCYQQIMEQTKGIFASDENQHPHSAQDLHRCFMQYIDVWKQAFPFSPEVYQDIRAQADTFFLSKTHKEPLDQLLHAAFNRFTRALRHHSLITPKARKQVNAYMDRVFSPQKLPLPPSAGPVYRSFKDFAAAYYHASDVFFTAPEKMTDYLEAILFQNKEDLLHQTTDFFE